MMLQTQRETGVLALAFSVIIASMITIASVGVHYLGNSQSLFSRLIGQHNDQVQIMSSLLRLSRDRSLTLQQMLLTDDPFLLDEHRMQMGAIAREYNRQREHLLATELSAEERELLSEQHRSSMQTGQVQNRIAIMALEGEGREAKALLYREAIPGQAVSMELMEHFIALQYRDNARELAAIGEAVRGDKGVLLLLAACAAIFCVVIAILVTLKLRGEIRRRRRSEEELEERVRSRTEELAYNRSHDSLTSLPNRAVFSEQLGNAIELTRRYRRCAALLLLDIDGLKAVNRLHGYSAGDRVLRESAARIKQVVRSSDIVARFGEDEFSIIINNLKQETDITAICEKIIHRLNRPIALEGSECRIGISIGVTLFFDNSRVADELLTAADEALSVAKRRGKNRCHLAGQDEEQDNILYLAGARRLE